MAANANNKQNADPPLLKQAWLMTTNFVIAVMWARAFSTGLTVGWMALSSRSGNDEQESSSSVDNICLDDLGGSVKVALYASFLELFSSLLGITRSPIWAVGLFSCVRFGVEKLVAPMVPCTSWEHLLTVIVWGLGDTIRFGCFAMLSVFPGATMLKSIRFTISPLLFPVGAALEMLMVIRAGSENHKPILYVAASLWPICFYPMMQQLMRQRRKHFASLTPKKKVIKAV